MPDGGEGRGGEEGGERAGAEHGGGELLRVRVDAAEQGERWIKNRGDIYKLAGIDLRNLSLRRNSCTSAASVSSRGRSRR